jgi:hypothetical protein
MVTHDREMVDKMHKRDRLDEAVSRATRRGGTRPNDAHADDHGRGVAVADGEHVHDHRRDDDRVSRSSSSGRRSASEHGAVLPRPHQEAAARQGHQARRDPAADQPVGAKFDPKINPLVEKIVRLQGRHLRG